MTWKQAWDVNPPRPGDVDWPQYVATQPAEATRLHELRT